MIPRGDRITLPASELPGHWYNVLADLPVPMAPPIHPGTGEPVGPQDLERLFAPQLIEQEMSSQREIPIPDAVREILSMWRPTPLIRARNLERALGTPARIYFKNEGVSPAGSHKPNTAVPQAYYNSVNGIMRLATETGAGQWGSALAFATRMFGMACRVFMVRVSYEQKPYRRTFMRLFGADVFPSPSPLTQAGRDILAEHPDSPGSLGIAISEAVEEAASRDDTNYALGSVLNHVLLHQTVIGQEARTQLDLVGEEPDFVYGCHGGGSNFGGIALPFMPDVFAGGKVRAVAVEPESCPTLTRGRFAYDFGDTARLTPILQMYTLGHDFVPPAVHAGGLRYHGASPIVSALVHQGADGRRVGRPDRRLQGRRAVRPHRGDRPRPGVLPRHRRGGAQGTPAQGRGPRGGDPVLALGPRLLRHGRLRRLPRRQARGLRVPRPRHRGVVGAAAAGGAMTRAAGPARRSEAER